MPRFPEIEMGASAVGQGLQPKQDVSVDRDCLATASERRINRRIAELALAELRQLAPLPRRAQPL
jgi:hypothetical protein